MITELYDVPAYQLCCGCGICAYLYPEEIKMVDVLSFGRRPDFGTYDGAQGKFEEGLDVCPGVGLAHQFDRFSSEGLIDSLKRFWGPVLEVWEGHAVDPEIRYKGSSGGAITAISLYCLEHGKMNGVLHVGADSKMPYLNTTILSENRGSLLDGVGSRYSPASPCEKLDEIEKKKGVSVIVGKPCDIAAVQSVRKIRDELDGKIGLTIACFCAGTPSTNGTLDMLCHMGVGEPDKISDLRYRGYGWPGATKVGKQTDGDDEGCCELSYEESWGDILQKYRQWRCYICPDHTGEFADISVGDPWYKNREEGDQGRSLILVRTVKGKSILTDAIRHGYLSAEKKEEWVLPASQPNLQKTRSRLWGRLTALKLFGVTCPKYSGFSLKSSWTDELSFNEKLRSIVGTAKRIYIKKLYKRQEMVE